MVVGVVTIKICRKTGETISREIIEEYPEDEERFYRPLVGVLGDRFLESIREKKEGAIK